MLAHQAGTVGRHTRQAQWVGTASRHSGQAQEQRAGTGIVGRHSG
jgi:hypothetical protein